MVGGVASSWSQTNLKEFKDLWDLYIHRIIQRPWSISNKFGGFQEFMRSLYTSNNTKTLINLKQILEEFKNLWDLYIRRITRRPWSISSKFGGVQEFMRSLYTSDNTKTLIDLKQILEEFKNLWDLYIRQITQRPWLISNKFWRSSRIDEVFIYVG
jgi:hypothetical protein